MCYEYIADNATWNLPFAAHNSSQVSISTIAATSSVFIPKHARRGSEMEIIELRDMPSEPHPTEHVRRESRSTEHVRRDSRSTEHVRRDSRSTEHVRRDSHSTEHVRRDSRSTEHVQRDLPCEPYSTEHVQRDLPCEPRPTEHVQRDLPHEPHPPEHVQRDLPREPCPTEYMQRDLPHEPRPTEHVQRDLPREPRPTEYMQRDLPHEPRPIEHVQRDLPREPRPTEYMQRDLPREPRPIEHVQRDLPREPRPTEHVQRDLPHEPRPIEYVQRDLPREPRPTEYVQIEVAMATEMIALMNNAATDTLRSRHEYEELKLQDFEFAASDKSSSLIRGEHHYDDPNSLRPMVCPHGYEEPVSTWKRLSMPSLDTASLVPGPHMYRLRRNSSVSELAAMGTGQQEPGGGGGRTRGVRKPGKIPHYAEFSLYPTSAQTSAMTSSTTAPERTLPCLISTLRPHEYEEPTFSLPVGDVPLPSPCHPIPVPLRFLRRAVGDYEVPRVAIETHKAMPTQSMMQQVRRKLSSLSTSVSRSFDDEETETLIDAEHSTKDTTPDQLKSPMSFPSCSSSCEVVLSHQETINDDVSEECG